MGVGLVAPLAPTICFEVPGEPVPQGSGRPIRAGNGRLYVIADSERLQPWRDAVTWHARQALADHPPLEGAVRVELAFVFARPRGHYGRRGLRPSAPLGHAVRPDLDALVGAGVIQDDAQVAELHATKGYGERPGLAVTVRSLEANEAEGPGALPMALERLERCEPRVPARGRRPLSRSFRDSERGPAASPDAGRRSAPPCSASGQEVNWPLSTGQEGPVGQLAPPSPRPVSMRRPTTWDGDLAK